MAKTIDNFGGENRWLSNFEICNIEYDGLTYTSTESAFQSAKTLNMEQRRTFSVMNPREAKRAGKTDIQLRPDWESVKNGVMLDVIRYKFTHNNELRELLLATGDAELIEGNRWGDTYWGVCNGVGQNNLGKIIMLVRDELRSISTTGI